MDSATEQALLKQVTQLTSSVKMMANWITFWIVLSLAGAVILGIIVAASSSDDSGSNGGLTPSDCAEYPDLC